MNPFDSYMLNKVRRLKDVRTRYAATGEKAVLAGVPVKDPAAAEYGRILLLWRPLQRGWLPSPW